MKFTACLILLLIALALPKVALAGDATSHEEIATNLRLELLEVQAKEAALQGRLQQLDDDIKPENIERALAGIGSTKPEELREHRRRLLSIERDGVRAQLKVLETSRTRLEAAIVDAEAKAYQESAQPNSVPEKQVKKARAAAKTSWMMTPAAPACQENSSKNNEPDLGRELNSRPAACDNTAPLR
jgi:hypothetical protein